VAEVERASSTDESDERRAIVDGWSKKPVSKS